MTAPFALPLSILAMAGCRLRPALWQEGFWRDGWPCRLPLARQGQPAGPTIPPKPLLKAPHRAGAERESRSPPARLSPAGC